jgi:GntR family transcriptional repressor for pyruvate dehydrogenase complex
MDYSNGGRLSLSDEVYNHILVRISEGTWKEGDKIPSESALCRMFNVSRVSVRAALQKLQGHGLITTKQGIGSFVTTPAQGAEIKAIPSSDISGQAFLEFFEFRQAIEFKAIDLFVIRATQQDIETVSNALSRLKNSRKDYKAFTDADFDFHTAVIKGAKNNYLYNALVPFTDTFYHYLEEINRLSGNNRDVAIENHENYFKGLLDKKPSYIKQMMLADNAYYHVTIFKEPL